VRQGQQNRRGRGRNNNRKGHHNPLSRSFESNGPNERIRGTPAHIAEKYMSYAREAQSSGDPVLAENYLQHAEHYNRIIMAYREQMNQPSDGMNGGGHRMRNPGDVVGEGLDEFGDEHGPDAAGEDGFPQPGMPQAGGQPRPHGGEHGRPDRPFRRDQNRPRFPERAERHPERGERHGFAERDRQPDVRAEPQEQDADSPGEQHPRRRERVQQMHEQPEFLRRPVRRTRSENGDSGKGEPSRD
jgi:Domain of unknown function (DUF4167)